MRLVNDCVTRGKKKKKNAHRAFWLNFTKVKNHFYLKRRRWGKKISLITILQYYFFIYTESIWSKSLSELSWSVKLFEQGQTLGPLAFRFHWTARIPHTEKLNPRTGVLLASFFLAWIYKKIPLYLSLWWSKTTFRQWFFKWIYKFLSALFVDINCERELQFELFSKQNDQSCFEDNSIKELLTNLFGK